MGEYLHRLTIYELENANAKNRAPFNMKKFKNVTLGEMKEEIQKEEAEAEKAAKANSLDVETASTLSLANARAYAERYYQNYNYYYPSFSNDCTNFVSQILLASGEKHDCKS